MLEATLNYIHAAVRVRRSEVMFKFIFVYGNRTFSQRRSPWGKLMRLKPQNQGPGCCLGDFNEMKESNEKEGVRPADHNRLELFRGFLNDSGLMDLEIKGCKFTWMSNPRNGVVTKQKIDRALSNWAWRELFPHSLATAQPIGNSDHAPIILKPVPPHRSGTNYKYEAFWEDSGECRDVVATAWSSNVEEGDSWGKVTTKLNRCKYSIDLACTRIISRT